MKLYGYLKISLYLYVLYSSKIGSRVIRPKKLHRASYLESKTPILKAMQILTGSEDGKKEENFGGGNLGAYYNFMYPDNTDYPWACICSGEDFNLWLKKEQPYVRCRNQEDLSIQDIQANCDPKNVANYQDTGFYIV